MNAEGSVKTIRDGSCIYRRIHSANPGRAGQTFNFQIPPHIIAEAMQVRNEHSNSLAYQWSAPSSDDDMKFIERYVREKYPEVLIESKDIENIAPQEAITTANSSPSDDLQRWFFPQDGNKTKDSSNGTRARLSRYLNLNWAEEPSIARLNPNSRLREVLARNVNCLGNYMSVPEIHARYKVLQLCGVDEDEYHVVFTSSRHEALLLIAEAYPFHRHGVYLTGIDSDLDVILPLATHKGSKIINVPLSWLDLRIDGSKLSTTFRKRSTHNPRGLFAYPLKSREVKHPMDWVSEARRNLWHVLIDASQQVLDVDNESLIMENHKPDYLVCVSPKHNSFPNRVSCLLVRRSSQSF